MLGTNRVIAKDVKILYLLLLCQLHAINIMIRGNALDINRRYSLPFQTKFLQPNGRLFTMQCVTGLVPCCGQDGYQAQVPQHHIETQHNIYNISEPCRCSRYKAKYLINGWLFGFLFIQISFTFVSGLFIPFLLYETRDKTTGNRKMGTMC